jgi:hypothetical protein
MSQQSAYQLLSVTTRFTEENLYLQYPRINLGVLLGGPIALLGYRADPEGVLVLCPPLPPPTPPSILYPVSLHDDLLGQPCLSIMAT